MKTVYVTVDEYEFDGYDCPNCETNIMDYTGEEAVSRSEYCGACGEEFYIEIIE